MSEKKYSPREAALAVLKKTMEIYKESALAKSEGKPMAKKYEGFKAVEESASKSGASDPAAVAAAVGMKKYGKKAFEEAAHSGHKMGKSEENPDEKEDAQLGEEVEHAVEEHEKENPEAEAKEHSEEAHEAPDMKGHIKLAKFMGRMEAKREAKAKGMAK